MNKFIHQFASKPKRLFLIDASGAFITFALLLVMLTTFQSHFGMPSETLIVLIIVALILSTFSICCFFFVNSSWQLFMKIISLANILYCCLTAALIVYHFQELTILGIAYFLLEIIVITSLIFVERKVISLV